MRLIKQGDEEGCGLACVAMAGSSTYAAVRKTYREVLGIERTDKIEGTQLSRLKEIMRRHGVSIEGRARRGNGLKPEQLNLDCDALLKVNLRLDGEEWHWVIWDNHRRRVLDPKQKPYVRLKCVSYWKLKRPSDDKNQ